jgi:hypothetical protein
MDLELTSEDKKHLETLNGKLQHVRDAVRGVVKQFHTGMFLWGPPGMGKSKTVLDELTRLEVKYVLHNSRITGRGLVDALRLAPSDIHVIEDAETLMDDRRAWGVLRSALGSQDRKKPPERLITWIAFKTYIMFVFTGGIIVLSNRDLSDCCPELRALKSRVQSQELDLTNLEMLVLMKVLCQQGHIYGPHYLTPEECWEIACHIIDRLESLQRKLDLRLLLNGFKDRMQWQSGNSQTHWKDLLEARMEERVIYRGRDEQKAEQSRIAFEIHQQKLPLKEKMKLWKEKTGLEQAAFYAALNRLGGRSA